jgi:GT2 family glycosyltransferase
VIIVVKWNGQADTLACLASLARIDYPAAHVVVVDNGSTDDSVAVIRAAFPAMTVLEIGHNLGYVGGNNAGLEYARQQQADYALLLNNNTEVAPDFLTRLVEGAEAAAVGAASPAIYYHALPESFWSMGGPMDWQRGDTTMLGEGQQDTGQFGGQPFAVDFVTGCALLIKIAVVDRIGPLDARFFAYYEDVEWCVRVGRAGDKVAVIPAAKIWHKITPKARFASDSLGTTGLATGCCS